jgi:hypothetical protein
LQVSDLSSCEDFIGLGVMDDLTARHYDVNITVDPRGMNLKDMNKNTQNPQLEWQTPEIEIISFQETESGAFDGRLEMNMTDRSDVNPVS